MEVTEHILVTKDTRAKLDALKVIKRETYDSVINRLLRERKA